jgi:hypothetical protein
MSWDEWARRHFAVFGMTSQAEANMLAEWQRLFQMAGFSALEMAEATDWVATHDPPRFRGDQLQALQARARARRQAEAGRRSPEPAGPSCGLCGGDGVAGDLPDPEAMVKWGGKWRTCACWCKCPLGRYKAPLNTWMESWDQYESRVPDWRERQLAHQREEEAYAVARTHAGTLDRQLGELLGRMRARERQDLAAQSPLFAAGQAEGAPSPPTP